MSFHLLCTSNIIFSSTESPQPQSLPYHSVFYDLYLCLALFLLSNLYEVLTRDSPEPRTALSHTATSSPSTCSSDAMSGRPQPSQSSDRKSSGLIKTLESLGRTRGSSATPAPSAPPLASPIPNRAFQTQFNNMNNTLRNLGLVNPNRNTNTATRGGSSSQQRGGDHVRNPSSSSRSGSSNQDQGVGVGMHDRNLSSSTHRSGSTQEMGFSNAGMSPATLQYDHRQGPSQSLSQVS